MRIIWEENNIAHLARHEITPAFAEKIIEEGIDSAAMTETNHRYVREATINNKHYRLICDISNEGSIYPVTAFQIRKRKI